MNVSRKFHIWNRDDAHCEKVLLEGGKSEVQQSEFGANDFVVEALMKLGLWEIAENMYPDLLGQENGIDWKILNRV